MSVKVIQILVLSLTQFLRAGAEMGLLSARQKAACSSSTPSIYEGVITVVF